MLSIVIDVDIRHDSVQFSKNIRFLSPKRQDLIYHVSLLVAIHIFFQFINHSFSVSSGTEGRSRTHTPKEHDFESCASANSATSAS